MTIVAADWLPYCLPLRRPWQTSQGSLSKRRGSLLRLRTADGLTGWGDCAPLPEFGIEEAAARALAEECAQLDLAAQHAGLPLGSWLAGKPLPDSVAVNAALGPISTATPEAIADALTAGYRILKFKVGSAPLATEIAGLTSICATLPPDVLLRLDANGAWGEADAGRFLLACRTLPVDGVEEPLQAPDAATLRRLQALVSFPLALDEAQHLIDDLGPRHRRLATALLVPTDPQFGLALMVLDQPGPEVTGRGEEHEVPGLDCHRVTVGAERYPRSTFSIGRPLASSSTSLSR